MASTYYDSTGKDVVDGDTAVASDLNTINTAVDAAFQLVESDLSVITGDSAAWAALAQKWAEEAYSVEVEPGKYSALHHATDAATDAAAASASASAASSSAGSASASASTASTAASNAGISETNAAADAAQTALDAAATAADAVATAADAVTTAADRVVTTQDAIDTAADAAATAADKIATNADAASTAADAISTAADAASATASATAAELDAWEAEAEQMTADSYATEAEDVLVNVWTSDGDGTFTATPTTDYSSLHHATKAAASAASVSTPNHDSLVSVMLPTDWPTVNKQGWDHFGFNQQWGGAPWGGRLVDGTDGEVATSNLTTNSDVYAIGGGASTEEVLEEFRVPYDLSLDKVAIRLKKDGNPTDNLEVAIYSGGTPGTLITNGTATAQSGKLHSSEEAEVIFDFPTPPTLVAGTDYNILLSRSGVVDASNKWIIPVDTNGAYPYGVHRYKNAGGVDICRWSGGL